MHRYGWQKSSFSGEGDACIHLAATSLGEIHLHESDSPDAILTTTPGRLRPLMAHIRSGFLARPRAAVEAAA
ncbi:DUF397 domain-containing protein [Streptomyces griseocarneus]|nr:DUF397 domain-containing protein [Streptomyces griseocarneus]